MIDFTVEKLRTASIFIVIQGHGTLNSISGSVNNGVVKGNCKQGSMCFGQYNPARNITHYNAVYFIDHRPMHGGVCFLLGVYSSNFLSTYFSLKIVQGLNADL